MIQGSICDSYQLIIYNMSNVIQLDTGEVSLGSDPLYQDNIFSYTLNSGILSNGNQFFWTLTTWNGTLSATSKQTPFYCFSIPNITMSVPSSITSKKYTFTSTYSQTENVSIKFWYMVFLDSDDNIILQTSNSSSAKISYEFDGFLNNQTYKVYTVATNQQNIVVQSPTYEFTVTYSSPSLITSPSATLLPDLSATKIEWSPAYQTVGTITGTSEYYTGLFTSTNTGLVLNSSSDYVEFVVDIPLGATTTIDYIPSSTFLGGKMIRQENEDSTYFEVGYNAELGCYYYDSNGFLLNSTPKEFINSPILIAIKGIEVLIIYNNEIYDYIYPH